MPVAKGERFGGRAKGTRNRLTIERQLEAKRAIDRARANNEKLSKEMLRELMFLSRAAMARHQEITPEMVRRAAEEGRSIRPSAGNWERFGEWFDRCAFCAKGLLPYEHARIRQEVEVEFVATSQPPMKTINAKPADLSPADATMWHLRVIRAPKDSQESK